MLRFEPGLQPSEGVEKFLADSGTDVESLAKREIEPVGVGWRQVRWVVLLGVLAVCIFLFATQPALPGWLTGTATAVTSLFGFLLRARDQIASLLAAVSKGA